MNFSWQSIIWQQFGAAIDMLDNVLHACPGELWRDRIWDDPADPPEYTEFWFVVYHTLFWLDLYLSGVQRADFTPPAPFVAGRLPEQPYSRAALQGYLDDCRRKGRGIFAGLTDEQAAEPYEFPWSGLVISYAELQLYNMRHVQEHAAQLSLHLGKSGVAAPDWVSRADQKAD